MNTLPSTSSRRAPYARLMKSGAAPTDLNARTGLSTPPGRMPTARLKRRADLVVFMNGDRRLLAHLKVRGYVSARNLCERAGGFASVVGDDDVRTGAPNRCERL